MENKRNSKKTVKLLVVLIALLLIACSILGITLARYVTQGDPGTAGVNIAQWNIYDEEAPSGGGSVRAMLSPAMAEYTTGQRTNTVAKAGTTGFRITNKSDVKAIVTLKITNTLNFYSNSKTDEETGLPETVTKPTTGEEWNGVELSQIITATKPDDAAEGELALVQVYPADSDSPKEEAEAGIQKVTAEDVTTYTITLDVGEKLEVTIGEITWTSDLTSDNLSATKGTYGDLRDTWIGENVGSVGFAYSWYAVQGSQLPDGGVSEPTP